MGRPRTRFSDRFYANLRYFNDRLDNYVARITGQHVLEEKDRGYYVGVVREERLKKLKRKRFVNLPQ